MSSILTDGAAPIRVAVIITRFTAGAGGVALRGAEALDRSRFVPTIFTSKGGALASRARDEGIEVVDLDHMSAQIAPMEDRRGVSELTTHLRAGDFDLVHTHSAKAGAIGRLSARRSGVEGVVHTFHGFPFHPFQSTIRRQAYIAVERRLGRITDHFLAVGAEVAADAIRLKIAAPERITVIDSAVEPGGILTTKRARLWARRVLRVPPGMQVVGTVGRVDEQKAPLDMIDAIARLGRDDVYLVWIGSGPLLSRAKEFSVRKGLERQVAFVGESDAVVELLPAFDVFAMSSLYEGIPCSAVEAIVAGIPIVATAVNAVPEIVVPGKCGLLARPRDPASLASALKFLLDHPERAQSMATSARAHIAGRFHPEGLGADLVLAYGSALDRTLQEPQQPKADNREAV